MTQSEKETTTSNDLIYWKIETLQNLQALPTDAKPIKGWADQDEAFLNVTEGIRNVVMQLTSPPVVSPVVSVALSADGQTLVSGSGDATNMVWRA